MRERRREQREREREREREGEREAAHAQRKQCEHSEHSKLPVSVANASASMRGESDSFGLNGALEGGLDGRA